MIQLREPSHVHASLAFVSWAYLTLFAKFGYSYVLTGAADLVRMDLADGHTTRLGLGAIINLGGDSFPVAGSEISLVSAAEIELNPTFTLVGLGVQFGATLVALPLASDPQAARVRGVELFAKDDGSFQAHVVGIPLGDLYPEAAANALLGSPCNLGYREGSRFLRIVGTTKQEAIEQVRGARRMRERATVREPSRPTDTQWRHTLRRLPASLSVDHWPTWVSDDVVGRLRDFGASDDLIGLTRETCLRTSPERLPNLLKGLVPTFIERHVDDARRVLLDGAGPKSVDPGGLSAVASQLRLIRRKLGSEIGASIEVFGELIDPEGNAAAHGLRIVVGSRELALGEFYSFATLLAAARVLIPNWQQEGRSAADA